MVFVIINSSNGFVPSHIINSSNGFVPSHMTPLPEPMADHQLGSYKYISIEFYSKFYFSVKQTDLEMSEKIGAIVIKHQYINNHFLTHLQHSP